MSTLADQLLAFPPQRVLTAHGPQQFRRAHAPGTTGGITHVLLHGIGSGSASWLAQLQEASARGDGEAATHVVAWDAPGYADSAPLPMERPSAADYAARLWDWLDALIAEAAAPFTLVGHSLGALMAANAVLQRPERIARLVLLAPAAGYGAAPGEIRDAKRDDRLAKLAQLGPAGMAAQRGAAMLSPHATPEQVAYVQGIMAGIHPAGYTQATHMLAEGDLAADLRRIGCPVTIASGSADTITPAAGCRALAEVLKHATYLDLGPVGHTCALEAAPAVNRLIGLGAGVP